MGPHPAWRVPGRGDPDRRRDPDARAREHQSAITVLAVAGSYVAFVPVAWWLSLALARPALHGMLMGAVAAAIYIALSVGAQQFVPDAPPVPLIYYVAHVLKLAGGATGGWLAGRAPAPAAAVRV
jgi:hypothetical protein